MEGLQLHSPRRRSLLRHLCYHQNVRQGISNHHDQGVAGGLERVLEGALPSYQSPTYPFSHYHNPLSRSHYLEQYPPKALWSSLKHELANHAIHRNKKSNPSLVSPPKATPAQEWYNPHQHPSKSKCISILANYSYIAKQTRVPTSP
jgi:hypothetical protein